MSKRRRFTKLTRRQRLFVEALNRGAPSATAAARIAGYSERGIRYAASRLMHHPKIRALPRPSTRELLANPKTAFRTALRLMKLHGIGPRMPPQERKVEHRSSAIEELHQLTRELRIDPQKLIGGN
jgi:phage terminase small subunit